MTVTLQELTDAALSYAARGWRVFPVRQGGKEPATEHGVKDATTNTMQIKSWWAYLPYNIGIATGPESGIFVIDVDPRNGGKWRPSPEEETLTVRTGGGGWHYYYQWPEGAAKLRSRRDVGIDVKGAGGYVVAPPSVTTGPYTYDAVASSGPYPRPAPAHILADIAIAAGAVNVDARPGDNFNEQMEWEDILGPEGWTFDHEDGELRYWTRPGKDDGVSATTGIRDNQGDPKDLLYVFTTSTIFEPERGYDKFGAYALLHHDGDVSAAASALSSPAPRLHGTVAVVPAGLPLSLPISPPEDAPPPAGYTPALPPNHFVSRYVEYAGMLTDAAPEYHEAAALVLLAAMTPTVRINLATFPGGLPTNLYTVLVGESSRSRKSTAQQIAAGLAERLIDDVLLPDRMTGESAIRQLAVRSGKSALWMRDELGLAIAEMYQVGYMSALDALLLSLYSGQTFRYTTVEGQFTVENVHLNIFGSATPESFAAVGSRAISSGLLPRFGVVYPAVVPPSRPPQAVTPDQEAIRYALHQTLRNVQLETSRPGGPREVTFKPSALATLAELDADLSKQRLTARLSVAAFKVAALLTLAEHEWEVEHVDAVAASIIVRRWAAGAMRLREHLGRPSSDYAFMELMEICRESLRKSTPRLAEMNGRRVLSRIEAAKLLRLEHRTLNRVRDSLSDTGEVQVVQAEDGENWLLKL